MEYNCGFAQDNKWFRYRAAAIIVENDCVLFAGNEKDDYYYSIGGAGEATVLARVGEGIVTTVGSAITHSSVLENPDDISKVVLEKGLDSGTAYEIMSIDIADIDIGRNIGANLQSLQAEANTKIAQAKAEERRAMAVALEQEMKAEVVKAEADIPRAMAEALRSGNLGVLDYYNLKNVQADTKMKNDIGNSIAEYVDTRKDKN